MGHKYLKTIHLLGFALLISGLFAQLLGAPAGKAKVVLLAGFWGLTLSGIAIVARSKGALLRQRWLQVHLLVAVLGAVPAIIVIDHFMGEGFMDNPRGQLAVTAMLLLLMASVIGMVKPRFSFSHLPLHSEENAMRMFSKPFLYGMSFVAVFTIFITTFMDVNSSHMTNPMWPPHARFHWAAQYFATLAACAATLFALWGRYADKGSRLSVWVAGLSPLLFWGMFIPALLMPGTSTMPDGFVVPDGFPEILTVIHPNFIISCLMSVAALVLTVREQRRMGLK